MQCPKIRPINAFPVDLPEGRYICLQDPNRYQSNPMVIAPETFFILRFFDGEHSFGEVQEAYMRQYGELLYAEHIEGLIEQLDQYLFLESPTFFKHLQHLRADFARLPVRPSSHQGAAYPEEQAQLRRRLKSYFTHPNGPGALPSDKKSSSSTSSIQAIMSPHIDLQAGGPTFAWAYHALAASNADLFVILGTSHVEMQNFLALTRKSFETPFGRLETDQTFVQALAGHLSYNPFEDELIHKEEHSIEFQVVFLQYLFGKRPITIVPILCGGLMHEAIAAQQPFSQTPQLEESIAGLQRVLEHYPNACVIASVDFSHVGVRYGDRAAPNAASLRRVELVDRTLLSAMEQVAHDRFAAHFHRTRNATNVCGVAPIYTLLRLLEGAKGTLLHYDCVELNPGCFVSFASMVWKK